MTYDDDPRGQHVYSPEDSDTQRFGDWQTKVAAGTMIVIVLFTLWVLWK